MAMAFTPATHIRCTNGNTAPRILLSFIPGSNSKSGKVVSWNAASNYVKLQVGPGRVSGKPHVVTKSWMKRASILRCATIEEIEAEKSLIEKDAKGRMEKTIDTLRSNFLSIRTGRANPAMLDKVEVEYYGTPVALKSIAQLSTPDASSLLVQPYDKSSLKAIEKAIVSSDLGLTPNNDGEVIRLTLPQLTLERRKYPGCGILQPGAYYMQHQQAQQMTPQSLMDALSSMLYSRQQYSALQQEALHSQLGMNNGGTSGHMLQGESHGAGGSGGLGGVGFPDFSRNTNGEGQHAAGKAMAR